MKDGIILLDSKRAKKFGFTSNRYYSGWLWKKGDYIIISFIESKGYLLNLFNSILKAGYKIKVPTPLGKMQRILELKGFRKTYEYWKETEEDIEIWIKEANKGIN